MSTEDDSVGAPTVRVERMALGGRGVARLPDGRVVFVPGVFPGEEARLADIVSKKNHAEAKQARVTAPAAGRITPACAVAHRCGGCDWMALSVHEQRRHKLDLVWDALERGAKADLSNVTPRVHVGESEQGYRLRIRLQLRDRRLGFFEEKTHLLVEPERCLVCSPALWEAVQRLRRCLDAEISAFEGVRFVELRCLSEARVSAFFGVDPTLGSAARRRLSDGLCQEFGDWTVFVDTKERVPAPFEVLKLAGDVYTYVPVGGFCQVNAEVNRALIDRVVHWARAAGARSFLDLYCGSGNFSLPLLALGLQGDGVEAEPRAIEGLRRAASEQGWSGDFRAAVVDRQAKRLVTSKATYDLVVVDPPRSGAKGAVETIARLAKGLVLMVSCDPATLARDVRGLLERGHTVVGVEIFDMFPQTHHVETLVALSPPRSAVC